MSQLASPASAARPPEPLAAAAATAVLRRLASHPLRTAVRRWRLAFALALPGALIGLLAAVPMLLGMRALAAAGPWPLRLADGDALNALIELGAPLLTGVAAAAPDSARRGALLGALASLGLVCGGLVLEALAYAWLVGGVLERLAGRRERAVLVAGRHWFGPMLRYSLSATPLFLAILGLGAGLLALLASARPPAVWLLVLALLWLSLADGLLEVGRASLVLGGERRARQGLLTALALLARPRLLAPATLAWLALAALGLLHLIGSAALLAAVPASASGVTFAAGQVLALLGAWLKLLRLALALELARGLPRARSAEPTFSSTIPTSEPSSSPASEA